MGRFAAVTWIALVAAVAAMAATAIAPIGVPMWHYNVAFALLVVGGVAVWPFFKRRRVATMLMAHFGGWATLTGFILLYTKADLKATLLKDWMKWWHCATSVGFMLAFLVHWYLNNPRLMAFTRRILARVRTGTPVMGVWTFTLVAGAMTWTLDGRALFTEENYLYLSSWALLLCVAATYGVWLAFRTPGLRKRLQDHEFRSTSRAGIDTSLFLACWLSLLTGFALLYFKDFLHGNGFKYVAKWWHTATSLVFLAFVTLHIGFNARLVKAHARRIERDLR